MASPNPADVLSQTGSVSLIPTYFHSRAVSFGVPGGSVITLSNNPVLYRPTPNTILVNRRTQTGILTYRWAQDVTKYELRGITGSEGRSEIDSLAALILGRTDVLYLNALDPTAVGVVAVTQIIVEANGQSPSTFRYSIFFQESQQFSSGPPA